MPVAKPKKSLKQKLLEMPDALYKYRALASNEDIGRLRRMLLEGEVYLARGSEFNDPFDLSLRPSFEASNEQIRAYWDRDLKLRHPRMTKKVRRNEIKKFIKKYRGDRGAEALGLAHDRALNQHGIFCLCGNVTNTLMWSYYADGHRGVAVRFATRPLVTATVLKGIGYMVFPVDYEDSQPVPRFYTDTDEDYLRAVAATKSTDWRHEREVRLLLRDRPGVTTVAASAIDGVVFGLRTPDHIKRRILRWTQQRPDQPIELLQVTQTPGRFNIEVTPAVWS